MTLLLEASTMCSIEVGVVVMTLGLRLEFFLLHVENVLKAII
jgi:hypothetical protein